MDHLVNEIRFELHREYNKVIVNRTINATKTYSFKIVVNSQDAVSSEDSWIFSITFHASFINDTAKRFLIEGTDELDFPDEKKINKPFVDKKVAHVEFIFQ